MADNDKQVDGTSVADTDEIHEAQHLNDNGAYPYASQPCRLGQLMLHMLCWKCGGNRFLWQRDSAVEYVHIVSFNDEDTPVVDDTSWQTTDGEGTGDTWVSCLYCGTELMRDVDYAIGEATQ